MCSRQGSPVCYIVDRMDPGARLLGFRFWLCHFLTV